MLRVSPAAPSPRQKPVTSNREGLTYHVDLDKGLSREMERTALRMARKEIYHTGMYSYDQRKLPRIFMIFEIPKGQLE